MGTTPCCIFVVPQRGRLFTLDAVGMYGNITTHTALDLISGYLRDELTLKEYPHYNADALITAMEIVFRNNIIKFGDTHWKQLSGTSMGIPPAPPFASLFEGINENKYISVHADNLPIYKRCIDDGVGCWVPLEHHNTAEDEARWTAFKQAVNNNCLTWIFEDRSMSIDFMDMTMTIVGNTITTTMYEKPTALHLYIPPHSSHPPGCVKGHIYGETLRINRLCSAQEDITNRVVTFFRRLRHRGYSPSFLIPQFKKALDNAAKYKASSNAMREAQKKQNLEQSRRQVYFHLDWHPQQPNTQDLQHHFENCVLRPPGRKHFNQLLPGNQEIPLEAMVVAYHRTHNIGDLFSYRNIENRNGPSVSSLRE